MITKRRAIELHRELWDWLLHHPSKGKRDWPRWLFNGGDIEGADSDCFLCECHNSQHLVNCEDGECILAWPKGGACYNDIFEDWCVAKSPATRKRHARTIRDLPERKV